ncbi:MerR family transcriptional regulator [Pseudalkalibacillus decolorationis]|uniref:MerR family transcriptional regulator n=1 Tax=Pseudalkalibacillus decolorationis TaxID=163879 RepID=UPI00214779B1|nr:MerR family transcriptional regulator [Pseudalkalibacillus decolorationis]
MVTIQHLSKQTKVTTRTLRYYDSIQLLKPSGKTEGGHRLYSNEDVLRLQQIQFLKQMGFQLKEIQSLLENNRVDVMSYLKKPACLRSRGTRKAEKDGKGYYRFD